MDEPLKLVEGDAWEVDIVDIPGFTVRDVELAGVLMVVERSSGAVRGSVPLVVGEAAGPYLMSLAMDPPEPFRAERPEAIWCRQERMPELAAGAMMLDTRLRATTELPGVDEAAAALAEHMAQGIVTLPPCPEAWTEPLAAWVEAQPWRNVSDGVQLLFAEGVSGLVGRVGTIMGQAGEQRGFLLYPSGDSYRRFVNAAGQGPGVDMFGGDTVLAVNFDPVHEVPRSHLRALERLGLVHQRFALITYAMSSEGVRPLEEEEEDLLLAALEASWALWVRSGGSLDDEIAVVEGAHTALGQVSVLAVPEHLELIPRRDLLEDVPHRSMAVVGEDGRPAVVVKMAKRDAQRLARALERVDMLVAERNDPDEVTVVAWQDEAELGVIATLPGADDTWELWREHGAGWLIVAGGGARRPGFDPQATVFRQEVDLAEAEFDPAEMWDPREWDGPVSGWPDASQVLLAFAAPLRIDEMPLDEARELLDIAATIFSAVAKADTGDPRALEATAEHLSSVEGLDSVLHMMVDRKRRWFGRDERVMRVDDAYHEGGQLQVRVSWDMATR